jgi:hypothetical protein
MISQGSGIRRNDADAEGMTSTLPNILPSLGYAAPPRFHPAIWPLHGGPATIGGSRTRPSP